VAPRIPLLAGKGAPVLGLGRPTGGWPAPFVVAILACGSIIRAPAEYM
jgi:hypothetical protein